MAPKIDDRWIWLGFGIFFFLAAHGIRHAIEDILLLTEDDPDSDRLTQKKREEQPEDTISNESLRVLAESPHPNISNAAISLIIARCRDDPVSYGEIRNDFDNGDEKTKYRARLAIDMINSWHLPPGMDRPGQIDFPLDDDDDDWSLPRPSEAPNLALTELQRRLFEADSAREQERLVPSPHSPVAGWTSIPRERPIAVGEEVEEMERRRWRREAMVLHEGEGGVEEGDIIRHQS